MGRSSGFGTWFYGFLVGGVVGVAACAVAALIINKAPIPFVNKVDQSSSLINPISGGAVPDPNKPLSKTGGDPLNAPKSKIVTVDSQASTDAPADKTSSAEKGVRYVVQAGAFDSEEVAEGRRAELGMIGIESRIIKKTEKNKTIYRVRLGPFGTEKEANSMKARLQKNSISSVVEKAN